LLRAEPAHHAGSASPEQTLAYYQQLFDGLVSHSEELSVALYSLGSPEILAAATSEIVALLDGRGLLNKYTRVLDLGCGIGRMELALSERVANIDAIDLSTKMVEVATRRCAALPNVHVALTSGRDLSGFAHASKDLVLAVDSFPYVVQAGAALVDTMLREAARVLSPTGHFVALNFSYRDDLARDRAEAAELARRHGFVLEVCGERPFRLWNGSLFVFKKP
jgi:predicted TPR repeat methyltransferase